MRFVIAAAALLLARTAPAARKSPRITIAQQFGVAFLPLMLMEREKLIEKHAKAAGIDVKTNWQKVAGPASSTTACCRATCTSARSARPR
jgi:NitT/TauT family transport system substrate-binding protein